jgi:hypothetical protein
MALSTELRAALASRQRPRLRKQARELPLPCSFNEQQPGEDPDDSIDPDDFGPRLVVSLQPVARIYALPPPSPAWSHLLSGRPHESASASSARIALLAVSCRFPLPRAQTRCARLPGAVARVPCARCWCAYTASRD